jgi:predicted site-specific integrase-resolvase
MLPAALTPENRKQFFTLLDLVIDGPVEKVFINYRTYALTGKIFYVLFQIQSITNLRKIVFGPFW